MRTPIAGISLILATAAGTGAAESVGVPWLTGNLVTNAGFEQPGTAGGLPPGWSAQTDAGGDLAVAADAAVALDGVRSLRLSSTGAALAGGVAVSAPFPVEAGGRYLFSIAFRQEGFNTNGAPEQYAGVSSLPQLTWLDAGQRPIGKSSFISRFPYGPSGWDLRDAFETAPAGAAGARVEIRLSNDSLRTCGRAVPARLWVDAVQVRRYLPPPTPDWARGASERVVQGAMVNTAVRSWFAGGDDEFQNGRGGQWSRSVDDPLAERGVALAAPPNVGAGIMAHSPYFQAMPPGLYRLRARVRLPAAANRSPAVYLDVDSARAGTRLLLPFAARADAPGGAYADYEGDFILRDAGWWDIRIFTHGEVAWGLDSIKVFPLHELSDRERLTIYPGSEGAAPPPELAPAPYVPVLGGPVKPMEVLVVAGFGFDRLRLSAVFRLLHRDARVTPVWVQASNGAPSIPGLPEDAADWFRYSLVCLCDVGLRGMSLRTRGLLKEYVRRGGALLVLGGHQGYERGGWRGSLLEEALPIEIAPVPAGGLLAWPHGQPVVGVPGSPVFAAERPVATGAVAFFLHDAKVKPSGTIWATVGARPFLVAGEYGKGRVACVLGLPYGEAAAGQTAFWDWPGWIDLLRDTCWWTMKHGGDSDRWSVVQSD
jgi:hypothetical protein